MRSITICIYKKKIIGYAVGWVITDEIHIANLAVEKPYRQLGIGRKLIKRLIEMDSSVHGAFLEVRRTNKVAVSLYAKLGFEPVGVRKNYYTEDNEDAILMRKEL